MFRKQSYENKVSIKQPTFLTGRHESQENQIRKAKQAGFHLQKNCGRQIMSLVTKYLRASQPCLTSSALFITQIT